MSKAFWLGVIGLIFGILGAVGAIMIQSIGEAFGAGGRSLGKTRADKMKYKPFLVIGAIVVLIIAVSGCATQQETTQPAASAAGGQQSTSDPLSIAIKSAGSTMQVGTWTPKSGYKYVLYNVTVKNNNAKDQMISPASFALRTSESKVYDTATPTYDPSIDGMQMVMNSQPGDVVSGILVYEIPQSATPTSIQYNDVLHKITTTL